MDATNLGAVWLFWYIWPLQFAIVAFFGFLIDQSFGRIMRTVLRKWFRIRH